MPFREYRGPWRDLTTRQRASDRVEGWKAVIVRQSVPRQNQNQHGTNTHV
jgi:hypothetical protein